MKKNKKIHATLNPTTQFALALGLLLVATLASRGDTMRGWEVSLFHLVYNFSPAFQPLFLIITLFGSIYALGVLLIMYLLKQHYHIVLRLLMTGALAYLGAGLVKDTFGRSRPDELIGGVVNLDYVRGPGFPSGHSALAVALALTIGHYLPKKYHWLVPVWIVGVGLSRVYLGVHAPLDIVGGFAVGWASYALFRHVRLYDVSFVRKHSKDTLSTVKKS